MHRIMNQCFTQNVCNRDDVNQTNARANEFDESKINEGENERRKEINDHVDLD